MKNRYRNKDAHARRKVSADARKAERAKLTDKEQLAKLDKAFGENKGATKERIKLYGAFKDVKSTVLVSATPPAKK